MSVTGEASADAGFTLLETLVAFLIVALALQAVLVLSGRMIAELDASRKQQAAARILQNTLDGLEVKPGLMLGGHHWFEAEVYSVHVDIRREALEEWQRTREKVRLLAVSVHVEWEGKGGARRIGASTLRLQPVLP